MNTWTPEQWNYFFLAAGGFVTVLAVQVTNMIISIRNGRKTDTASAKVDANTEITQHTRTLAQSIAEKTPTTVVIDATQVEPDRKP